MPHREGMSPSPSRCHPHQPHRSIVAVIFIPSEICPNFRVVGRFSSMSFTWLKAF